MAVTGEYPEVGSHCPMRNLKEAVVKVSDKLSCKGIILKTAVSHFKTLGSELLWHRCLIGVNEIRIMEGKR